MPEERFKDIAFIANAAACVTLVGVLALPVLGMPMGLLLGAVVAGMQAFVLRLHFMEAEEPADDGYADLVSQIKKQVEDARQSAMYDSTFGLYQRWYLENRLKQEIARSRRYGLSLALIVVRFEERGGQHFTDAKWQSLASEAAGKLTAAVRKVDLAAIVGEREFALSLVACDRKGAEMAMERLSESLGDLDFNMGLTVFPEDDAEPARLIELAQARVGPLATPLSAGETVEPEGAEVFKRRLLSA